MHTFTFLCLWSISLTELTLIISLLKREMADYRIQVLNTPEPFGAYAGTVILAILSQR